MSEVELHRVSANGEGCMIDAALHKVLVSACLLGPCSLRYDGLSFKSTGGSRHE